MLHIELPHAHEQNYKSILSTNRNPKSVHKYCEPLFQILLQFKVTPICSMYGIFNYIGVIFRANVGKYSIHGSYGI